MASAAVILGVLGVGYVSWGWLESVGDPRSLLERCGVWLLLVTVPIHIVLSATPFPSEIVGVTNGALHGLWLGALLSWIGWWVGALLEYSLVRLGLREVEARYLLERASWSRRFPVAHPVFLILGRQLPFGVHAVNVLAAVAEVPLARVAACAAVSNVPYALVTAAAGAGLMAVPSYPGVGG